MLKAIKDFFEANIAGADDDTDARKDEHAYQLATAALLFEIGRADQDVQGVERTAVARAVQRAFELDAQETEELVKLAELEAEQATSLYEFTRLINDNFSPREKEHVVELLWRVAYADGELDKYEEHLVRRIADLIHVPHARFIKAKHSAKSES